MLLFGAFDNHPHLLLPGFPAVLEELRAGVFEVFDQLVVGLVAFIRILGESPVDDVGSGAGDVRGECLKTDRLAFEVLEGDQ